jgi:hypothetical protein
MVRFFFSTLLEQTNKIGPFQKEMIRFLFLFEFFFCLSFIVRIIHYIHIQKKPDEFGFFFS